MNTNIEIADETKPLFRIITNFSPYFEYGEIVQGYSDEISRTDLDYIWIFTGLRTDLDYIWVFTGLRGEPSRRIAISKVEPLTYQARRILRIACPTCKKALNMNPNIQILDQSKALFRVKQKSIFHSGTSSGHAILHDNDLVDGEIFVGEACSCKNLHIRIKGSFKYIHEEYIEPLTVKATSKMRTVKKETCPTCLGAGKVAKT